MTDRKALHRKRKAAGYTYLGKFARLADLAEIEPHLLTAEQVDEAIEASDTKGEK